MFHVLFNQCELERGAGCNPAQIRRFNPLYCLIRASLYASVFVYCYLCVCPCMQLLQDFCLIYSRVALSSILHYFSAAVVAGFSCNGPFCCFRSTSMLHNMQSLRTMLLFFQYIFTQLTQLTQHVYTMLAAHTDMKCWTKTQNMLSQLRHIEMYRAGSALSLSFTKWRKHNFFFLFSWTYFCCLLPFYTVKNVRRTNNSWVII